MRNTLDALLRQLVFRNVGNNRKPAQDLSLVSDMGKKLDLEVAELTVVVDGTDLENVALVGSVGGTVSGRVVVEGAGTPKWSCSRRSNKSTFSAAESVAWSAISSAQRTNS